MNSNILFVGIYTLGVIIAAVSQVMLKISAKKVYEKKVNEYLNPLVISAYAMFFGTTLITVICFNYIELSTGVIIESTGYIFIGLFSFMLLKENFSKRKLLGTALVILGLIIYNF